MEPGSTSTDSASAAFFERGERDFSDADGEGSASGADGSSRDGP
jgi:hypothetical protein